MRRHSPPAPEIDGPAIASTPSSPSHPTSTVPPTDHSKITHDRNPTPKSDRLLASGARAGRRGAAGAVSRDRGRGAPFDRECANPAVGEDPKGMAHANGTESLRSTRETGYRGAVHRLGRNDHGRGVAEPVDPHGFRERHAVARMRTLPRGMVAAAQTEETTCDRHRLGGNRMGCESGGDERSDNRTEPRRQASSPSDLHALLAVRQTERVAAAPGGLVGAHDESRGAAR